MIYLYVMVYCFYILYGCDQSSGSKQLASSSSAPFPTNAYSTTHTSVWKKVLNLVSGLKEAGKILIILRNSYAICTKLVRAQSRALLFKLSGLGFQLWLYQLVEPGFLPGRKGGHGAQWSIMAAGAGIILVCSRETGSTPSSLHLDVTKKGGNAETFAFIVCHCF